MSAGEARRQALIHLGMERTKQAYRERSMIPAIENFLRDTSLGLRSLRKSPGYAFIVVFSLPLGIGATTAVFSVVYGVLLHPDPYPASNRMVHLLVEDAAGHLVWPLYSGSQFRMVQTASSIESVVGYRNREWDITGNDLPEAVLSTDLTWNGFQYFGIHPLGVVCNRPISPWDRWHSR